MKLRNNILAVAIFTIVALLGACFVTGCASMTPQKKAAWQAFAIKTLGSVAVNTLTGIAQQEISGGKTDYGWAAQDALWKGGTAVVNGAELYDLLRDSTDGKLPTTTKAVVQTFAGLANGNTPAARADVAMALAHVVQEATEKAAGQRHD